MDAIILLNLLIEINKFRAENYKLPLRTNIQACVYAEKRVKQIQIDWSHTRFYAFRDGRVKGNWYENLGKQATEKNIVQAWKNSPTHRKNLLANARYACLRSEKGYFVFEAYKPI